MMTMILTVSQANNLRNDAIARSSTNKKPNYDDFTRNRGWLF